MKTVFVIFDNLWQYIVGIYSTKELAEKALYDIKQSDCNQDYSLTEWNVD